MSSDYGTYRLTYTPPNDPNAYYPLITIDMSTPGDANVEQMLRFYEAFLAASGYILKGELQVVESEPEPDANPYFTSFANFDFGDQVIYGSQIPDTISFGGAGVYGGMAEDIIKF